MTKTILSKKQNFFIFNFSRLKRNFGELSFSIAILVAMILIISNPAIFSKSTISGIKLFFYSVLPGLFPFMFLTKLLTELGFVFKLSSRFSKVSNKIFGTPGVSLYAFFMSILSGYPIGAKIISDLYEKNLISSDDAKKMSLFCTTSGPIFVIGAVGVGMLSSFKLGVIIYISHIAASFLLGVVYNIFFRNKHQNITTFSYSTPTQKQNIINETLNETITSLLMVGGFITIFYLLTEVLNTLKIIEGLGIFLEPVLQKLKISKSTFSGLIYGLVEVTHGAKSLSSIYPLPVPLFSAIISFSGLSIIMQSMAFLKTAKIKTRDFVFSKCVLGILSYFICKLLLIIWN